MINQLGVWVSASQSDEAEADIFLVDEEDVGVLPRPIRAAFKIIADIFRLLVHHDTIQFYR